MDGLISGGGGFKPGGLKSGILRYPFDNIILELLVIKILFCLGEGRGGG